MGYGFTNFLHCHAMANCAVEIDGEKGGLTKRGERSDRNQGEVSRCEVRTKPHLMIEEVIRKMLESG